MLRAVSLFNQTRRAFPATIRGLSVIQAYSTFYLFSSALAAGTISVLPFVPAKVFGRRFFLLIALISIVFYVMALIGRGLGTEPLYLAAGGLLVLYQITLPPGSGANSSPPGLKPEDTSPGGMLGRLSAVFLYLAICAGWAGIIREAWGSSLSYPVNAGLPYSDSFQPGLLFNAATSTLLLGFSLGAMILGHWYLVSSKLSFGPLKRLTGLLCIAVFLRLASSLYCMFSQGEFWRESFGRGATDFLLAEGLFGLFVSCRFILGILLPAVLAILAWRCARIRSNQSATGILYVLVAFVFFGEILSKHFLANRGLGL